jgi:hypothetical protein
VPRWVVDDAHGVATPNPTWRGADAATTDRWRAERDAWTRAQRHRGRRRTIALVAAGVVVAAVLVGAQVGDRGPGIAPGPSDPGTSGSDYPAGMLEDPRPAGLPLGGPLEGPHADFRFIEHEADGTTPVTWSPCRPIHYVVRPQHQAPGALTLLRAQIAVISRRTGLRFVYDGTTTEQPSAERPGYQPVRYGDRWAPVLFAWVTKPEMSAQDAASDALGITYPLSVRAPDGDEAFVTGMVIFDADFVTESLRSHQQPVVTATMLHELGHLVGLDHVPDANALMYADANPDVRTFKPDELPGLVSLGRGPCRPGL